MPRHFGWSPSAAIGYRRVSSPTQIAKFMGPIWGPPGSCRPHIGPMLGPMNLAIRVVIPQNGKTRQVIVEFATRDRVYSVKKNITANTTDSALNNIYINKDLTTFRTNSAEQARSIKKICKIFGTCTRYGKICVKDLHNHVKVINNFSDPQALRNGNWFITDLRAVSVSLLYTFMMDSPEQRGLLICANDHNTWKFANNHLCADFLAQLEVRNVSFIWDLMNRIPYLLNQPTLSHRFI